MCYNLKILYVTSVALEYNSSANIRNKALISGLIALGHEVSTLSVEAQKDAKNYDSQLELNVTNRFVIPLKPIHSTATTRKHDGLFARFMKRIIYAVRSFFSIYDSRIIYANDASKIRLVERYDLMISSSDPKSSHRIAEELLKVNHQKIRYWIQYWGDPFADDINFRAKILRNKVKCEERRLIELPDLIVYVSPFTKNAICDRYPQFAYKCKWCPSPYEKVRQYSIPSNKLFTILYAGNYYSRDRDLLPLINAVLENESMKLILLGDSDIRVPESDRIIAFERVKQDEVYLLEEQANVLACVLNRKGTQIPGKIFQVAGTNKPILICADYNSSTKEIINCFEQFDRFSFSENKSIAISQKLSQMCLSSRQDFMPLLEWSGQEIARRIITYSLEIAR